MNWLGSLRQPRLTSTSSPLRPKRDEPHTAQKCRFLYSAVSGLPPVDARRQGGLLDVELAQDFSRSNQIYWTYYEPRQGGNGLAVARGRMIDGPQPRVENIQVVFRM